MFLSQLSHLADKAIIIPLIGGFPLLAVGILPKIAHNYQRGVV